MSLVLFLPASVALTAGVLLHAFAGRRRPRPKSIVLPRIPASAVPMAPSPRAPEPVSPPGPDPGPQQELSMSDFSVTGHNMAALLSGKATFAQFRDGELALLRENIASLPAAAQPGITLLADSVAAGASALVGIGQTVVGPILSDSSDHQASMVLNLLQLAGVPTAGPLSLAEQAILVQLINGLKAGLDHIGLKITAAGIVEKPAAAPAPGAA